MERRAARFVQRPSFALEQRIERALGQRLYLLTAERHEDGVGAGFAVLGSTGNVYQVDLGQRPSCSCPDFMRGQGLCKHVLFIWLRVLRLDQDDPRIWQKALLPSELQAAVGPLFTRRARRMVPLAAKAAREAYLKASSGSRGELELADAEEQVEGARKRQCLQGEDCPVCFEEMTAAEEASHLITFCCACGNNLHKDCIRRWQRASGGSSATCPFCRQPWRDPSQLVAPGEPLPRPAPRAVASNGSGGCRGSYLNLSEFT